MNKQKSLNVESNMKSKAANAEKGPNTVNSDVISPKTVCMPKGLNALFPEPRCGNPTLLFPLYPMINTFFYLLFSLLHSSIIIDIMETISRACSTK